MIVFLLVVIALAAVVIALQTPAGAQALRSLRSGLSYGMRTFDNYKSEHPFVVAAVVLGIVACLFGGVFGGVLISQEIEDRQALDMCKNRRLELGEALYYAWYHCTEGNKHLRELGYR